MSATKEEFPTIVRHTWSFQNSSSYYNESTSTFSRKVALDNERYELKFWLKTSRDYNKQRSGKCYLALSNGVKASAMGTFHKIMADGERCLLFEGKVSFEADKDFLFATLSHAPDFLTIDIMLDFSGDKPKRLPEVSASASLVGSLAKLYSESGQTLPCSDVELVCEKRRFKCHKFILFARSKVFATMFSHPMKEQRTNVVDIKDAKPEVLEKFIRFLYSDHVEDNSSLDEVFGLLALADKYDIENLALICQKKICSQLSVKDVWKYFNQAGAVNAPHLNSFVRKFIANHAKNLKDTPEWNSILLQHPDLMLEIMNVVL